MTPKQIEVFLAKSIAARCPVLVKGAPGIGKTDVIKKACETAKAELILCHPCVSDPTDYKGMPAINKNGIQADFLPFGDLLKMTTAKKLTVVFFDDIGQAPPSVQAALMQLLLAREINGQKISDNVVFVAATNRKQDKAGVSGMLEPVKSRFTSIVEMTIDHKGWIEWAIQAGLPVELIMFIQFRPNLLHDFQASTDLVNSPCPRTVANLGKLIAMDLPVEMQYETYSGAVGTGFTSEFLAFVPIMRKLPKIPNILIGNDKQAPKEIDVCFAVVVALSRAVTEVNLGNVLAYVGTMIPEYQVLFFKSATALNPELHNTKEMLLWTTQNSQLMI